MQVRPLPALNHAQIIFHLHFHRIRHCTPQCATTRTTSPAPAVAAPATDTGSAGPYIAAIDHVRISRGLPQATDYRRAAHFLDLRDKKPEERLKVGPELAQQLQEILDKDSQFDLTDLSTDPEGEHAEGLPRDFDRTRNLHGWKHKRDACSCSG